MSTLASVVIDDCVGVLEGDIRRHRLNVCEKEPNVLWIYTYGIKNQRSRESDMGDKLHYNCVCRRPSPAVCQMLGMNYEGLDLLITSAKCVVI